MNDTLYGKSVASAANIRAAEEKAIAAGVTEDELIDKAATELADEVIRRADKRGKILFVTGGGNNGADGLTSAKKLSELGFSAAVMPVGDKNSPRNEELIAGLKRSGVAFTDKIERGGYAVIVDCVFGIGLSREPSGEYARAIDEINASGALVIAADVPSGLDADTGYAYSHCVRAGVTVTFTAVKSGLLLGEGRNYAGEIIVSNIGIDFEATGRIIDEFEAVLPPRRPVSHKGNYGRVRVIGGSECMPGAPLMCFESAIAASRSGAGLVTLCVPDCMKAAYQSRVTETMLKFLPSENGKLRFDETALAELADGANAIVIGPGMGKGEDNYKIVEWLIRNYNGTLIIDADGLNALSLNPSVLLAKKCEIILTPHVAEFRRLCPEFDVEKPRTEIIRAFAKRYGVCLAVKSATTVVTDGEAVFFNVTGTPALAKGGSGDVLGGMAAAFACVLPPLAALKAACFHFGKSGERAAKRLNTVTSVLAGDVIVEIKYAE